MYDQSTILIICCMSNIHEHQFIFLREFTGDHRIYWCRECGTVMESFSQMKAHMIPEWSENRLSIEDRREIRKFKIVGEAKPKIKNRLGKSLKDMKNTHTNKSQLFKILERKDDTKK